MINLMPPAKKSEIIYARRNSFLIRWLMGICLAALGIALITGAGLFYLKQDSKSHQDSIRDTRALLAEQKEAETIKRAEEMSGTLQLAVDVLSKEILFSKLLQKIAQVIPPGTVLKSLSLDSELQGGLDLEVSASSYATGVRAQVNLADPNNGIFERADLGDVTCLTNPEEPTDYPCTATMRALFDQDHNAFLKLNQGEETAQ